MATLNFNAEEVPVDDGFEPIPRGTYSAQIIQSEMKDNKKKTGKYLELRIQILDAPYSGRLIFERLNLVNPNDVAVKIAKKTLAKILGAMKLSEIEDSEELHGIEFQVLVDIEGEDGGDYPPQNVVKKYIAA